MSEATNKRLIIGLGNPGSEYEWTRHNIGFLVVQQLAEQRSLKFKKHPQIPGFVASGETDDRPFDLLLPTTFMNKSGIAVKLALAQEGVTLENTLVVVDDFSLPYGQLRIRSKGSDGGHNGVSSIIEHINTQHFARLRLGIGAPKGGDTVDYVLGEFSAQEKDQLDEFINQAAECCWLWLSGDVNQAMTTFNKRKENE